jgi:hypothetical protein
MRRVPGLLLSLLALATVTGLLLVTAAKTGWTDLLQGFSANAVTAAVLAGFAYVIFILRFRRAKLYEYLERYRQHEQAVIETPRGEHLPPGGAEAMRQLASARRRGARLRDRGRGSRPTQALASRDALIRTVVDELLTARPPRSCLLVGAADIARLDAFAELPGLLAERKRVPIVVDVRRESSPSSIPMLTRSRFVTELVGAAGDEVSGGRVFAHLLARQRAVALVAGLESVSAGTSKRERRQILAELLRGCLTERLPFVAALPEDLAPSISEIAVLRIPSVSSAELAARITDAVTGSGSTGESALEKRVAAILADLTEPTRDPSYLELAGELLMARARGGRAPADAVDELFADSHAFRRHLAWMCEWALACSLSEAMTTPSAVGLALRAVGIEAHYRQELSTTWDDACRALDPGDERRFAAGVATLSQKGILSVSDGWGQAVLRFSHPGWLAFAGALGLGLDQAHWKDLLRPGAAQATLDALTAALLLDDTSLRTKERSFLRILEFLVQRNEPQISLDMALAVLTALQLDEAPLTVGEMEVLALERGWRGASDAVRLSFIADLDFGRHPLLIDFLWREVVPPAFHENAYRVRRALCERLASLGNVAWARLGATWIEVAEAARDRDLSTPMRRARPDWEEFGLAVASLCWVLPSLVLELEAQERREAVVLLRRLRDIAFKGWDKPTASSQATDIGIEISLAEGFKIAAARTAGVGRKCADWWCEEALEFLNQAKAWVSQQVLLQALALAGHDHNRITELAEETKHSVRRHPFVREAAALLLQALNSGSADGRLQYVEFQQYAWLDDVQALDDGGLDLIPEAHRLLGLSTLLINFAEHTFKENEGPEGVSSRNRAFTSHELPKCFRHANHTATMFGFVCDCEFHLCGPTADRQVGHRRFSRAFTKRAEATCRAPILSDRRLFSRQAFGGVWRALDRKLEAEQFDAKGA